MNDLLDINAVMDCVSRRRKRFDVEFMPMLFDLPEIILRLLIQPAFRRRVKSNRQTHRHFGADPGFLVDQTRQRFPTDAQRFRGLGDGYAERDEAKLLDDRARMRRIVHEHDETSMVIFVIDNVGMLLVPTLQRHCH